jgi:hypothetical protein
VPTLIGYGYVPEHVALVAVVLSQNDWIGFGCLGVWVWVWSE